MATHTQSGTGRCRFPLLRTDVHDGPKEEKQKISLLYELTYLTSLDIIITGGHSILRFYRVNFLYLFESTVQVELPPIEMVGIEREIIIFATVAGVRQNIAATFGEAKKDVSGTEKVTHHCNTRFRLKNITHGKSSL